MKKLIGSRIKIQGIVQGVGFRPFIYGLATRYRLNGWVRNTSSGVDIEVDGYAQTIDEFVKALKNNAPPLARIDSINVEKCPQNEFVGFKIINSEPVPGAYVPISPDVSICNDCLREMFTPTDRRYLYPFINCTNCGPRFTIIKDIPYDRPKTTMAPFEMCTKCKGEYEDPLNRRFHAQPVACPECGPHLWIESSSNQKNKGRSLSNSKPLMDYSIVQEAQRMLSTGMILAIKGLGGYHLACDATNVKSVLELRERKLRVDKPFALMMPDIETVEKHCFLDENERELLLSRERPIVLLQRKSESNVALAVAPNQYFLGVMLPYTPLHYLLFFTKKINTELNSTNIESFQPPQILVMTSGNISEEPIAYNNVEAREKLRTLADAFLMHNRAINMRCDDSVVRAFRMEPTKLSNNHKNKELQFLYPLRRSRGYSPNPLILPFSTPEILATGSEIKNTFCLTKDNYAFMSQHIGDMENYETYQSFKASIEHFKNIFRIVPKAIACDLHPNYLATQYAIEHSKQENISIYQIQHHHAHIAACMVDNGLKGEQPILGVSFDGTGYGDDGSIWGGEFLIADYLAYQRFGHIENFPLPGGDAAIRKPYRIALALLWHNQIPWDEDLAPVSGTRRDEISMLQEILKNKINTPMTSSLGRLFDAIAALTGIRSEVNYEAQAAIEFENLADQEETGEYTFDIVEKTGNENSYTQFQGGFEVSTNALLKEVITDIRSRTPVSKISARFHNGLVKMILAICQEAQSNYGISEIALSGGVWQNMTLLKKTITILEKSGFKVYIHRQVPTNDGGLALGQAAIAVKTYDYRND
jgi:hydrogenase maturation protein HypF